MVLRGKLKQVLVEAYKNKHPAPLDNVYSELIIEKKKKKCYPTLINLLKFALLIAPSNANVERGFSTLGLLVTKQRNHLSPKPTLAISCI